MLNVIVLKLGNGENLQIVENSIFAVGLHDGGGYYDIDVGSKFRTS
jgi:hypothetical protein